MHFKIIYNTIIKYNNTNKLKLGMYFSYNTWKLKILYYKIFINKYNLCCSQYVLMYYIIMVVIILYMIIFRNIIFQTINFTKINDYTNFDAFC